MTKTFDPFAPVVTDRPVLKFREAQYTLAEVTYSRERVIQKLLREFQELDESSDSLDVARLTGRLAEASCDNAEGLGARIVSAYEADEMTAQGLSGLVVFISEWLRGETDPEG